MQLKKLDEISKMAAVKASAALSKLIQQPVGLDIAPAMTLHSEEPPIFMKQDDKVVAITAAISGNIEGLSLFFFSKEAALLLCDMLLQKTAGTTVDFSSTEISALNEVANIVIGNFLAPFAYPLKLDAVLHHAPKFKCDSYSGIMEHINQSINRATQDTLFIEIVISLQHIKLKSFLVFVMGIEQMKSILGE